MDALYLPGGYLLLAYTTWVFYLAVMSLLAAKRVGALSPALTVIGYPVVIVGLGLDVVLNVASSVPFLELPREWVLTHRCVRHIQEGSGWRRRLALRICRMLDPFQQGGHCK